ncbi:M48 family metalloprotease [Micromonospora sp. WMMD961]|uniref:M48 family metalloprotease n=1 Tax=Micromonospora sp. WMMD961 TaxID=3016100 RepID=UPI002417A98F|nr:M48 family metalloprotease [Micromonospora sp. WMMD961]MDG4781896.1 M48 family metalloprotease [Micromonospora sp. WMMD961]
MAHPASHRAAPGKPAAYFVLLVGAVLATSVIVFLALGLSPPDRLDAYQSLKTECDVAFDAGVARLAAEGALDDVLRREALQAEFRSCVRPALAEPFTVVANGLFVLAVMSVAFYLVHPWWIVRRSRSRRLPPDLVGGLADDLDELRRDMGLTRAPQWWLVPTRGTTSGQAFGLPGRRRIQLDAGLLVLRATDRPAFRAVVAHELAHLRNRDVDLTYLTIAVWRAFLLVVAAPLLLLVVHPGLVSAPTRWAWRADTVVSAPVVSAPLLGALLVLGCLVYLLRNSVLRARETYADRVAADVGGGSAAIVERLPKPRLWLDRWGTHPVPGDRLHALRNPAAALRPTHWDLVAAGLPAGVMTANLTLVAGPALGVDAFLGAALLGLTVGPWLGALLALTVWRAEQAAAQEATAARRVPFWLTSGPVLVGSFMVGMLLPPGAVKGTPGWIDGAGLASALVAALVLSVGAVALAAWADSTARAALTRAGAVAREPARSALTATWGAAGLAGATALAVWLPFSLGRFGFALDWGPVPADGDGWYAAVAMVSTAELGPAERFVHHPLTLPTLTALWLVPALLTRDAAGWRALRGAALVGLGGGAVAAVIGGLLPVAAGVLLPIEARQAVPGAAEMSFAAAVENATLAVASVMLALAMAVVLVRGGPRRPARALFAAIVTTITATAAISWVAGPVACTTGNGVCRDRMDLALMSSTAHWILVQGLIVAIPLVVAIAVVRRNAASPLTTGDDPGTARWARAATMLGLVVLLAVTTLLVWGIGASAYDMWLRSSFG